MPEALNLGEVVALAILRASLGEHAVLEGERTRIGQLQRHVAAAALRAAGFPAVAAEQPVGCWAVVSAARTAWDRPHA